MVKIFLLSLLVFNSYAQNCDEIRQNLLDQQAQIELYQEEQLSFQSNVQALQVEVEKAISKNQTNWLWISGSVLAAGTTLYSGFKAYKAIRAGTFKTKVNIIRSILGIGTGVGSFFLMRKAYLNASELAQLNYELEQINIELETKQEKIKSVQDELDGYKENLKTACQN